MIDKKIHITPHDFSKIWNRILSKVRSSIKTINDLPTKILSINLPEEEMEKWIFVMERLNSDKDFLDEIKTRIGIHIELKVELWGGKTIIATNKIINYEQE